MRAPIVVRLALLAVLVVCAGCAKEKELIELSPVDMEPRDEKFFPMKAPVKDWSVVVSANSGGILIDLYLVKAGTDEEAAKIVQKANIKEMIASKVVKPNPTLEAKIPADTVYGIYVVNTDRNKRARVTIKVTEQ